MTLLAIIIGFFEFCGLVLLWDLSFNHNESDKL